MRTLKKGDKTRVIRLGHPLAFAALLSHAGASPNRYFRDQGLPTQCEDPDVFVPLTRAWSLFDALEHNFDPLVGWHVGRFVGDHNLNHALLSKLKRAPTLYQALKQFVAKAGAEASHLRLGLHERNDDILFFTHYPDMKRVPGYWVSQAYQLEIFLSLVQQFVGPHWFPDEIGLERPDAPKALRDRFPGTCLRTGQQVGYLTVPRSCLHLTANPSTAHADAPDDEKQALVMADHFDYVATLKALLRSYLAEGYPTAEFAASLTDTSPRTLARRLSVRGLSYSALVDELRFDTARKLLRNPGLKIIDVSEAVGFADQSHFARMFRRIGGLSPQRFRTTMEAL
jgi:AraC-like DNA-binding protein